MRLNEISDNAGARKGRTRVGRGIGSGSGKTAGRGMKGQKSRSGVAIKGFEGGQMPLHRRLPKRGFTNINGKRFAEIGLDRLQEAVDKKLFDAAKPVTEAVLKESGIITHLRDGVRVLGNGEIKAKLTLEVTGATRSAVAAIEAAGGSIVLSAPAKEQPAEKAKAEAAAPDAEAEPAAEEDSPSDAGGDGASGEENT